MIDNARYSIALCLAILLVSTTTADGQCLMGHLVASDGAVDDRFGTSVAISGDTAIVGANLDNIGIPGITNAGSAYVFVRSGGVWTAQAHLFASDGAATDFFAASVAIAGDTAVVGAPGGNTLAGTNAGSAYVFVRDTDGAWTQQAHLFASDGAANDEFGLSVAISGDTVVVTAISDDTLLGGVDAGSAYVFMRDGAGIWTETAHLFASDGAAGDLFGSWSAIAFSGDTIVLGAQSDDTPGGVDAGSAYVFDLGVAVWTEQAHLFASDGAAGDNFGFAVEISGDTVVVGANLDDRPLGGVDAGSAYVFVRDGVGGWTQQAHLFASDGAADDRFTTDIAISGDTVVVGAARDDTPAGADAGSAYVFVRDGSGAWSETDRLFASDGAAGDRFGYSVEMSGDTAVVGAWGDDTPDGIDAGSAYVFNLGCCPGDLDGSGAVDLPDLTILLSSFGCDDLGCPGDFDVDGDVDLADLTALLSSFGATCP